jgi:thioredoxin reductase (NADPH)
VSYWASPVEARLCEGQAIAIVGGGNSAGQAALFLAGHAAHVRLLIRDGDLTKHMSRYLADEIVRHPQVEIMFHTEVRELVGDGGALEWVVIENNQTGLRDRIRAKALFVFIGAAPHTRWLADELALDKRGFILTGTVAGITGDRQPMLLETSQPGIFAVGDVRSGSIKRVASAVGEGSMAVRLIHEYFDAVTPTAVS